MHTFLQPKTKNQNQTLNNMEQFYISSYIKFIWVIISHNSTSTSTSTQQSFKSFQQFNTKLGIPSKLILDSQLSATNLMISLYYLYKHYHTNNVLLHDYCFDVLDEEDDEEEKIMNYSIPC